MATKSLAIGLIIDTEYVSKYVYDLVEWAQTYPHLEVKVALMLGEQNPGNKAPLSLRILRHLKNRGLRSLVRSTGWAGLILLEKLKLRSSNDHADHLEPSKISPHIPRLHLTPIRSPSGLVYRFSREDLELIKGCNLDLLIRCGSGILRGDILTSTRLGIISFHHGDNRVNRGGPAGFWEVFDRNPETGFVIQKLTEELDGGEVLLRGSFPTQSFFLLNQANVLLRSNYFLKSLLARIARESRLPEPEKALPYPGVLLREPNLLQQMRYLLKLVGSAVFNRVKHWIFRIHYRWSVAFDFTNWRSLVLWRAQIIQNPTGRFLADPFVVSHHGRNFCFVEDFDLRKNRGAISVVSLDEGGSSIPTPVIQEDFHLSFPFVFEFNGGYFMVPETWQANEIRLYECIRFPYQWKFKSVLISDISAADSIIFEREDRWWLLTNTNSIGQGEHNSELSVFYADSPLSDSWTPLPSNPVILDASRARNGGYLFDGKDHFRVAQRHRFGKYGIEVQIMRIDELSTSSYSESPITRIGPSFGIGFGTHHMHSNNQVTAFDFQQYERW